MSLSWEIGNVRNWLSWFSGLQAMVFAVICIVTFFLRLTIVTNQVDPSPRASSVAYMDYLIGIWFVAVMAGLFVCVVSLFTGWVCQQRQGKKLGFSLFCRSLGAYSVFVFAMIFFELVF